MKIIEVEKLSYSYDGKNPALRDISFSVDEGKYVALIGHNGSGKSTLAKVLAGLNGGFFGSVKLFGQDLTNDSLPSLRSRMGLVFQNPDNQIVATVVEEDVAFALENLGVPQPEMRARVDEAMEMAGIYKHREKAPHKLSGGQKQRVAIAGVIAMRPDCLVLDESTAMLDPIGREKVMRTVKRLNQEFGITVVMITHYMEEAVQADRVLVMSEGQICLEGTPKQVFRDSARIRELKLDVPQAKELCDELRAAGIDLPDDIITAEECADALAKLFGAAG